MRRLLPVLTLALLGTGVWAQSPETYFTAREAKTAAGDDVFYYHCGFDDDDEFDTWLWESTAKNANYRFKMWAGDYVSGINDRFRHHNPASKKSLLILQSREAQDEVAYSPEINIQPESSLGFWLCTGAATEGTGWNTFANYDYTINILDVESNDTTLVLRGSEWIQHHPDYDRYTWKHISYDMTAFAGRRVRLMIHYWAPGYGDLLFLDDFELLRNNSSGSSVAVKQGQQVHYLAYTKRSGLQYQWHFPGGEPETSTEESPIVVYPSEGIYDVSLTVSGGIDEVIRQQGYVHVNVVSPTADYLFPDTVLNRVGGGCYVPNNTLLTLLDNSADFPTQWHWTFGSEASVAESREQNPTIYYPQAGIYDLSLSATNKAGENTVASGRKNIMVGGEGAYVWNISADEELRIARALIGTGEGFYGGSNTRHIERYAELFSRPQTEATISRVGVLLLNTATFKPDTTLVVSIHAVGDDGMPGEELGRGEMPLGEAKQANINQDAPVPETFVNELTEFTLEHPVVTTDPFFVVVSGIPPYELDHETKYLVNETYMAAILRGEGQRNTSYTYADSLFVSGGWAYWSTSRDYYKWRENNSTPVSLAIAPYVTYSHVAEAPTVDGVCMPDEKEGIAPRCEDVFDLAGRRLSVRPRHGLYIENGRKVLGR
ncbi:MAG: PKD domain-containing protein [Bacteroidaceae bacterium]|nr:PKD domain-containing protein [Bacteroidaceae bacterium]